MQPARNWRRIAAVSAIAVVATCLPAVAVAPPVASAAAAPGYFTIARYKLTPPVAAKAKRAMARANANAASANRSTVRKAGAATVPSFPHAFPAWCGVGQSGVTQWDIHDDPNTAYEVCHGEENQLLKHSSSGTVIGVYDYVMLSDYYWTYNSLYFHGQQVVIPTSSWPAPGVTVNYATTCSDIAGGSCPVTSGSVTPVGTPFTSNDIYGGVATFHHSTIATGEYGFPAPYVRTYLKSVNPYYPKFVGWSGIGRTDDSTVCDNALGGTYRAGCASGWFTATQTFSRHNPSWAHVAQNIYYAQQHGAPSLLSRTTNSTTKSRNTYYACKYAPNPRPSGTQCDEYPFASSNEGAAAHPTLGVAAPGCRTGLPETKSGAKWSACLVPSAENEAAGRGTGLFYYYHRIHDGEVFYVVSNP